MKIAIDISPLQSGHKVRGVGFYLQHLKNALLEYYSEHEYIFFTQKEKIEKKVDLVHYPYFDPFFVTLPLYKKYKTVVTVHDLTPIVFPKHFPAGIKGNLIWQMQRYNLSRVDAIITDSDSSSRDVAKYTGISQKKINTVYLAAGDEFKEIEKAKLRVEILKKYNLPEKFVLYVGDVTWNKNLPRLVNAVKQLDLPMVMVGKSLAQKDFDKANIWNRDLIEVHKLIDGDNRFIKLGFVSTEDLVVIYNLATVLVMPSIYEGFGLPILEAMQSGCPVITTKGGSIPEVAGDAAYYVDGYETQSIVKGIAKIFFDKKLQEKLLKKGFEQANKFNWKKTAEETIRVYESI